MAATKYTYSITGDFPNDKVDTTKLTQEIQASAIITALDHINTSNDTCDVWFKDSLSSGDEDILDALVAAHDGEPLDTEEPKDTSGKQRIHETSRPLGMDTYFTGQGDDVSDVSNVGGGEDFVINHIASISITHVARASNVATVTCDKDHGATVGDKIEIDCGDNDYDNALATVLSVPSSTTFTYANTGDDESEKSSSGSVIVRYQYLYLDFNIITNETWLHEGYIIWKDAVFDSVSLEIVPVVTEYSAGSDTYYNLYGGYLIIPAGGDGTITLDNDMTDPRDGLIYVPNSDLGEAPTAYWNADWNSSSKEFENIAAAPTGNGRYNMFGVEVPLNRFVNHVHLVGTGFERLQSADTAQLGQGMRLKTTAITHGDDHAWQVSCDLTMHRNSTK